MPERSGEKNQDPTPHRRQQAREQGHVARSQDLSAAVLLLGGLAALYLAGRPVAEFVIATASTQLGGEAGIIADASVAVDAWRELMFSLAAVLLPLLGLTMLGAVAGNIVQVGVNFLPERALPDLSRIDPLAGAGRLFSLSNLLRLPFGLLKLGAALAVAWYSLSARRDEILGCGQLPVPELVVFLGEVLMGTAFRVGIALLGLAAIDYGYQRWRLERDLRMTTQELREELRNLEGAPPVVARRKALRRQLIGNRPATGVPKADVVMIGPSGQAVALRYDPHSMATPVVVAKGAGLVAERMRSLAAEHGVKVVERPGVAELLYRSVEVNRPVPQHLFQGVAEVLARVFNDRGAAADG
ncbi:MAG: EscU/YscU/HrcU family type III secretion system export apparatus switch protein [Planctomycetia bacterium]|nr:EscU/YscU/HrcU family type III secretion system export apparatus switch protein [Planctomycetia bacterium]